MGSDYHYEEAEKTDEATGYPVSKYGYLLSKEKGDANDYLQLTNPYGVLYFAVGNGDDFVCFDYATIEDSKDGRTKIVLHASVNSETGCFIDRFGYEVCELGEAANVALGMVDEAIEWCCMDPEVEIKHSKKGWNQDEYYFYRCIHCAEQRLLGKDVPDFSARQMRMGGKKVNQFVGLVPVAA
jgi:hypothetical protein